MGVLLKIEGNCSCLKAKVAHMVGHLPPASRKVLEHNGFVAGGSLTLNGKPAMSYICELR